MGYLSLVGNLSSVKMDDRRQIMASEIVPSPQKVKVNYLLIATFIIAVVGLFLPRGQQVLGPTPGGAESVLTRVQRTKVLRVGYEGYPPYTIKAPSSGQLSG